MMRGAAAAAFCLIAVLASPVAAQSPSIESMTLATNLGSVLASEEFCGLTYNQDAIAKFIDDKVEADDLTFASMLNMQTQGQAVMQEEMGPSQKTAHCTQIKRVARSYRFVD